MFLPLEFRISIAMGWLTCFAPDLAVYRMGMGEYYCVINRRREE